MNGITRRSAVVAGMFAALRIVGGTVPASAQVESGNGGISGSSADGGTVFVGGNSSVGCIGANGGISTSDASGGNSNNAIIGSGDVVDILDVDIHGLCVPGTYIENQITGELVAFCTNSGRWIR